jgi:hypothetical protein
MKLVPSILTVAALNLMYTLPSLANISFTPPNLLTLIPSGGRPVNPAYMFYYPNCPSGACWTYSIVAKSVPTPTNDYFGPGAAAGFGWGTSRTGLFKPADNLPWTSFLSFPLLQPNPRVLDASGLRELHRYPYVCFWNPQSTSTTSGVTYVSHGCQTTQEIGVPALCSVSISPVIDFGVLPAGTTTRSTASGQLSCDGTADISIAVSNVNSSSPTVILDSANGITADMDVNGSAGLPGITFTANNGIAHSFNIGATLRTLPTSSAGRYSGVALVVTTWN